MNSNIIDNLFSKDEVSIIKSIINNEINVRQEIISFVPDKDNTSITDKRVYTGLGRSDIWGPQFPESIVSKLEDIANAGLKEKEYFLSQSGIMCVEYNSRFGENPVLVPHYDGGTCEKMIDYQLESNVSWGIGIDKTVVELSDNQALMINPIGQIHYRPAKKFNKDDFVKMIFFKFARKQGPASTTQIKKEADPEIIKIYNDYYADSGTEGKLSDSQSDKKIDVISNVLSDEQVDTVLKLIKFEKSVRKVTELDTTSEYIPVENDVKIYRRQGRLDLENIFLEESIQKVFDDIAKRYDSRYELIPDGAMYVEYDGSLGGNPFLGPHYDGGNCDFMIDYQLESNIDWAIGQDELVIELKDNEAMTLYPLSKIHYRPMKTFRKDQVLKAMFFRYTIPGEKPNIQKNTSQENGTAVEKIYKTYYGENK